MRPVCSPSSSTDSSSSRRCLVDLAVVDIRDELGEPRAHLVVLRQRQHGLRLRERNLARLAFQSEAQSLPSPISARSSCSSPPVSIAQWMPHSFGAPVSHHQRPARRSSPFCVGRVHGAQPIEV